MRTMNKWVVDVIINPQRTAMPVMTHPGVEITGKKKTPEGKTVTCSEHQTTLSFTPATQILI